MTETVEQIAAKLSEAQRQAIMDCDEHNGKLWLPFSRGVGTGLSRLGLVSDNIPWFWLNDKGLAVRAHLQEQGS